MMRFVFSAVIVAASAAIAAGMLIAYALTAPRGLVLVGDGVPPYFAVLYLVRGWLPLFVVVALGSAVSALFALAARWKRTHVDLAGDRSRPAP